MGIKSKTKSKKPKLLQQINLESFETLNIVYNQAGEGTLGFNQKSKKKQAYL